MKSLGFTLFCLLCTVAWAEVEVEVEVEEDFAPLFIADPSGAFDDTDGDYGLVLTKATWIRANRICRGEGMVLASPADTTEIGKIDGFLTEHLEELGNVPIWTSGSNQGSNSKYVWNSTGKTITSFTNFLINPSKTTTRCIGYNAGTSYLSNHDCKEQRYFLCSKPADLADCP